MSFYDTLNAQYQYISSLVSQANTDTSRSALAAQLQGVQTNLNNLDTTLNANLDSQNNVLTQQENVKRILDREESRLDQKKNSVDTILAGQRRLSDLNASYTAKYKYYNYIVFFVIVMAILFAIILTLNAYLFISESVATLLYTLLIAYTIVYVGYMMKDIYSRDRLDFNKLATDQLLSESAASTSAKRYSSIWGDMTQSSLGSLGYCAGPLCCASGTYFDISAGTCLVGDACDNEFSIAGATLDSFTTLDDAYKNGAITYNVIQEKFMSDSSAVGARPYTEKIQKLNLYPI